MGIVSHHKIGRGIVSLMMMVGGRKDKSLAARYIDGSRLMRSDPSAQIDHLIHEFINIETLQLPPLSLRMGGRRGPGLPSSLRRTQTF